MSKVKPVQYELRWRLRFDEVRIYKAWTLCRVLPGGGLREVVRFECAGTGKAERIKLAADWCEHRAGLGERNKLLICNKDGSYGKGHGAERSYGCDSRRRTG